MVFGRVGLGSADRSRPIGRDADAARVAALLLDAEVGLVTLVGPGGVGKTTLARFVAAAVEASFPDGVHGVDLTAAGAPDDVAEAICAALGLDEAAGEEPASSLAEHLRARRALLVLDNFEHVLDAATLVADLLAACPGVTVLATSREALRLRGERRYPLAPLALPSDAQRADIEALAGVAGVDLFVRRARAVAPDFALRPDNAADVAEIVTRLDGLPLAIELAAAHARHLAPAAFLARLDGAPLDLLSGGPRDQPARQRTLEATVAWSYDQLEEAEQRVFRVLGVFAGGFAPDAVASVASVVSPGAAVDVPARLAALADKSLVVALADGAEPRFAVLETLRAFALARLVEAGEEPAARRAHLAYYLALARDAAAGYAGQDGAEWLSRMAGAADNARMALGWSLDPAGEAERGELAIGMVAWMARTWAMAGRVHDGMAWIERARPHADRMAADVATTMTPVPSSRMELLARYWHAAGTMLRLRGADRGSAEMHRRAMAAFEAAGHVRGLAMARHDLASRLSALGQHLEALKLVEANAALYEALGTENLLANALGLLGVLRSRLGDRAGAREVLVRSLELARRTGNEQVGVFDLLNLAEIDLADSDLPSAESWLGALRAKATRYPGVTSGALNVLGRLREAQGQLADALRCAQDALRALEEGTDRVIAADAVTQAGIALVGLGDVAAGVRLLGAGAALRERTGRGVRDDAYYVRGLDNARAAAGSDAFDVAWAAGRALDRDAAIALALEERASPSGATGDVARGGEPVRAARVERPDSDPLAALTRREREVARLMARGHTNDEIAAELVIAVKTVEMHAGRVLQKLGFRNRAQLAAWAAAEGRLG